jgi:hypothetical protein
MSFYLVLIILLPAIITIFALAFPAYLEAAALKTVNHLLTRQAEQEWIEFLRHEYHPEPELLDEISAWFNRQ